MRKTALIRRRFYLLSPPVDSLQAAAAWVYLEYLIYLEYLVIV